jgi:hypothetical protein
MGLGQSTSYLPSLGSLAVARKVTCFALHDL